MKNLKLATCFGVSVFGVLFYGSLNAATPAKNTKYPEVQAFIDSAISANPQVEEINIYAQLKGKKGLSLLGSNDLTLLGKKADPEDLQVLAKNKPVTLKDPDDPEITDITYPIEMDGKTVGVIGIMYHAVPGKTGAAYTTLTDEISKSIISGFVTKAKQLSKPIW